MTHATGEPLFRPRILANKQKLSLSASFLTLSVRFACLRTTLKHIKNFLYIKFLII